MQRGFGMAKFKVLFYQKADGSEPVKQFLNSLDKKMRAKMVRTIEALQNNGNDLHEPSSKHLDDGIFELRAKVGTDISRVLYFFFIGQRVILTNGFIKKTQKTPKKEINLAKKYRNDFLQREEQYHE